MGMGFSDARWLGNRYSSSLLPLNDTAADAPEHLLILPSHFLKELTVEFALNTSWSRFWVLTRGEVLKAKTGGPFRAMILK